MYVSPSVKNVPGCEEDELLESDAFSFIHEQDLPDVEKAFDQVRQKPASDIIAEYRFQHKKGQWVYLESVADDQYGKWLQVDVTDTLQSRSRRTS